MTRSSIPGFGTAISSLGLGPNGGVVILEGHTMGAIKDGWLIYFNHDETPPSEELIGELVVCAVANGQRYVRFLQKGSAEHLWTLQSVTGEPVVDVKLLWAERVQWIRPAQPGDLRDN